MSDELLSLSEVEPGEIASRPDWQKEEAKLAAMIQTSDRYLALPDRFEVNEWSIMAEFCDEVKRATVRTKLLRAIRRAIRFASSRMRSRATICGRNGINFVAKQSEPLPRDWCQENGITRLVRDPQAAREG